MSNYAPAVMPPIIYSGNYVIPDETGMRPELVDTNNDNPVEDHINNTDSSILTNTKPKENPNMMKYLYPLGIGGAIYLLIKYFK